ncbi:hypothetical protein B0H15DRAFT_88425 [Mycena belliarum]|uniref:C2H2-type domain-containing protein n=1 Tax=Mycena belliarum TaxID=1033014 RepID=A0AAD6XE65_9AGAR|nr:hypothetical protein B0H15DRAFT_88425 [Mycena belliae]
MPRDHPTSSAGPSSSKSEPDAIRRATCTTCGVTVKRPSDLPRHMLTHAKNKEELMFQCPFPECGHKTLQRSNLETHIRIQCVCLVSAEHLSLPTLIILSTNARPLQCVAILADGSRCTYATSDPSSLYRHKKRRHETEDEE